MIKFLAKLAAARLIGGAAAGFRPKGVKGMVVQALMRRFLRR